MVPELLNQKFRGNDIHLRMGVNTHTKAVTSKFFKIRDPNGNITALTSVTSGSIDPYSSILESVGAISSGVEFAFGSDVSAKNIIYIIDTDRETDVIGASDFSETQADVATELNNRDIRFHSVHTIATTKTADIATLTGGIGAKNLR